MTTSTSLESAFFALTITPNIHVGPTLQPNGHSRDTTHKKDLALLQELGVTDQLGRVAPEHQIRLLPHLTDQSFQKLNSFLNSPRYLGEREITITELIQTMPWHSDFYITGEELYKLLGWSVFHQGLTNIVMGSSDTLDTILSRPVLERLEASCNTLPEILTLHFVLQIPKEARQAFVNRFYYACEALYGPTNLLESFHSDNQSKFGLITVIEGKKQRIRLIFHSVYENRDGPQLVVTARNAVCLIDHQRGAQWLVDTTFQIVRNPCQSETLFRHLRHGYLPLENEYEIFKDEYLCSEQKIPALLSFWRRLAAERPEPEESVLQTLFHICHVTSTLGFVDDARIFFDRAMREKWIQPILQKNNWWVASCRLIQAKKLSFLQWNALVQLLASLKKERPGSISFSVSLGKPVISINNGPVPYLLFFDLSEAATFVKQFPEEIGEDPFFLQLLSYFFSDQDVNAVVISELKQLLRSEQPEPFQQAVPSPIQALPVFVAPPITVTLPPKNEPSQPQPVEKSDFSEKKKEKVSEIYQAVQANTESNVQNQAPIIPAVTVAPKIVKPKTTLEDDRLGFTLAKPNPNKLDFSNSNASSPVTARPLVPTVPPSTRIPVKVSQATTESKVQNQAPIIPTVTVVPKIVKPTTTPEPDRPGFTVAKPKTDKTAGSSHLTKKPDVTPSTSDNPVGTADKTAGLSNHAEKNGTNGVKKDSGTYTSTTSPKGAAKKKKREIPMPKAKKSTFSDLKKTDDVASWKEVFEEFMYNLASDEAVKGIPILIASKKTLKPVTQRELWAYVLGQEWLLSEKGALSVFAEIPALKALFGEKLAEPETQMIFSNALKILLKTLGKNLDQRTLYLSHAHSWIELLNAQTPGKPILSLDLLGLHDETVSSELFSQCTNLMTFLLPQLKTILEESKKPKQEVKNKQVSKTTSKPVAVIQRLAPPVLDAFFKYVKKYHSHSQAAGCIVSLIKALHAPEIDMDYILIDRLFDVPLLTVKEALIPSLEKVILNDIQDTLWPKISSLTRDILNESGWESMHAIYNLFFGPSSNKALAETLFTFDFLVMCRKRYRWFLETALTSPTAGHSTKALDIDLSLAIDYPKHTSKIMHEEIPNYPRVAFELFISHFRQFNWNGVTVDLCNKLLYAQLEPFFVPYLLEHENYDQVLTLSNLVPSYQNTLEPDLDPLNEDKEAPLIPIFCSSISKSATIPWKSEQKFMEVVQLLIVLMVQAMKETTMSTQEKARLLDCMAYNTRGLMVAYPKEIAALTLFSEMVPLQKLSDPLFHHHVFTMGSLLRTAFSKKIITFENSPLTEWLNHLGLTESILTEQNLNTLERIKVIATSSNPDLKPLDLFFLQKDLLTWQQAQCIDAYAARHDCLKCIFGIWRRSPTSVTFDRIVQSMEKVLFIGGRFFGYDQGEEGKKYAVLAAEEYLQTLFDIYENCKTSLNRVDPLSSLVTLVNALYKVKDSHVFFEQHDRFRKFALRFIPFLTSEWKFSREGYKPLCTQFTKVLALPVDEATLQRIDLMHEWVLRAIEYNSTNVQEIGNIVRALVASKIIKTFTEENSAILLQWLKAFEPIGKKMEYELFVELCSQIQAIPFLNNDYKAYQAFVDQTPNYFKTRVRILRRN